MRAQLGRERADDREGAEEASVELQADVGEVPCQQRRAGRYTSVVDQDGHVAGGIRGGSDGGRVGDVERDRSHALEVD